MQTTSSSPGNNNNKFSFLVLVSLILTLTLNQLHMADKIPMSLVFLPAILFVGIILVTILLANYAQLYIKIRKFFRKLNGRH
jgi:hypothetical protein